MANKIQRGRSGNGSTTSSACGPAAVPGAAMWGISKGGVFVADSLNPGGRSVSSSGTIAMLLSDPLGADYTAFYRAAGACTYDSGVGPPGPGDLVTQFAFELIAKQNWFCSVGICVDAGETPDDPEGIYYATDEQCLAICDESASGRYVCSNGSCNFDPAAVGGFTTMAECLASCSDSSDGCNFRVGLRYDPVEIPGKTHRVTANYANFQGPYPDIATVFTTPFGTLSNETYQSVLVNVPVGSSLAVTANSTDTNDCTDTKTITIGGDEDSGTTDCTARLFLGVVDEGGGSYLLTERLLNVTQANPSVQLLVDNVATEPLSVLPRKWRIVVPYGDSKQVAGVLIDGDCTSYTILPLANADADGGSNAPPTPIEGDCVERLGIYYRDIVNSTTVPGALIKSARFGLEVRALCPNPSCHYWFQEFTSSNLALRDDFSDAAMAQFFPVPLEYGQRQEASGQRLERYQIVNGAVSRPATTDVILRLKATPVYQRVPLDLAGNAVKIRELDDNGLFVFTQGAAKAYRWNAPSGFGSGTKTLLSDIDAIEPTATDAALVNDKLYVIAPGEVFVIDLTAGESVLNSGVRGEPRAPAFIENVGGKPVLICQDDTVSPKVRAYDLSFPTPKPAWTLNALITETQVIDGKLLLAAGPALYSSNAGTGTPSLLNTFPANITAIAQGYVGLSNNRIYRLMGATWSDRTGLVGPVGAVWPWLGGADDYRGLAGAVSGTGANTLRIEQTTLNWTNDITLDDATGVLAMRALFQETTAATETNPPIGSEWMLIGDDNMKLWVYSRSALSEADGAFKACTVAAPRITPTR